MALISSTPSTSQHNARSHRARNLSNIMSDANTTITDINNISISVSVEDAEVWRRSGMAWHDAQRALEEIADWFITGDSDVERYLGAHTDAQIIADMHSAGVIWPALANVDDALAAVASTREDLS